jgi:NAD(P)-dependent dehydrogenase (short-subunit alcohol dehydrogenase family)
MDLELAGKVVLITGASGGLGREMAVDFGREDARVVVHYRSGVEAAEVVAETIEGMGGEAMTAQADLTDRASLQHMLNEINAEWGGVDVLINGAVAFEGGVPIEQLTSEQWHRMIETTLTGAFYLVSLIAPHMRQQKWGRIVNIASRTGLVGGAKLVHYSAAKAGLIGLTRALAKELGPDGILVNAIAPTTILTPKEREKMTPDRQEKMIAQIPLHRIATPDDISRVALFLGSGMNTFVNGEVITVGGGAQT